MLSPKERKYLAWCLWHTGSTSKEACDRAFTEDFKITDTTISIRVSKPLSESNISRLQGYVDRMIEENGT